MIQRRGLFFLLCMLTPACSASTAPPTEFSEAGVEDTSEEDTTFEEDTGEPEDTATAPDTRRDTATDTRPPACIRPGASGCSSYGDCCDAECQSGVCCKTRLQSSFVCSTNSECCDGYCTSGKCCVPPGKKCSINSMCCSNWCGRRAFPAPDGGVTSDLQVCCNPAGRACATNDDCCSNSCAGGTCACLPSGSPCAQYADSTCCSGSCSFVAGTGYRCK